MKMLYSCPKCDKHWTEGEEDGWSDNAVYVELCEDCKIKASLTK